MVNWKKCTIIVIILVSLLSVSTVSAIFYEENRYNQLQSDHRSLQSNYDEKVEDYSSLYTEHTTLQNNYGSLRSDHTSLQWDYDSLETNYNSLNSQYTQLQADYNSLEEGYYALDEDYEFYKNSIEIRYGYGSDCQLFITPEDSSVISTTRNILGHYSDDDLSWDDMKDINNWVGGNIDYNYDTYIGEVRNCYQYPSETLELMRGDCEDHAVLMVSMCKAEGSAPWLYCASIKFYKGGEYHYHQIVFINVADDKLYIFDPTTKPAWFGFGDVWHSSSSKSEESALGEYRNKVGASSIVVIKIFNENTRRSFSSNQDFYDYF